MKLLLKTIYWIVVSLTLTFVAYKLIILPIGKILEVYFGIKLL